MGLDGYDLNYGRSETGTLFRVIFQIPKILTKIKREKRWLDEFLKQNSVDLIISDNRFGFYHDAISSIFITHQLAIRTGLSEWLDNFIRRQNYRFINRFRECWVPDQKNGGLGGELSHPVQPPAVPVRYLGCLSRFNPLPSNALTGPAPYLLILISGPEPQRSIFENLMLEELKSYNGTAVLLRGLPASASSLPSSPKLIIHNHLPAKELNVLLCKAKVVLSRSGYSSIMDLMMLKKKCIFIPTPGQPEQQYLADYLHRKQFAISFTQKHFSLKKALQQFNEFAFKDADLQTGAYKEIIGECVNSLNQDSQD